MKNLIQQKDELKDLFSEQQLIKEMQMPSGIYDQFLVLTELQRRKRINDDQARNEAADDTKTVAQEVVNAAGVPQSGIAQLASTMNAKTDNTQNTGVQKMADGGVVKMQTAGKPPSIMSNIMSLMSPPSYDVAGISKPRVATEPEMTGLEAIETIPPDAARALEISKKLAVGRGVKKALKEVGMTGLEAANLILGAGAYITLDTAYKSLNILSTVFPQESAKVVLDLAQTLEDGQADMLFKKHGNWLQRNLPRLNPNFAYTFDDREKAAEALSIEELEAIRKSSEAAIAKADTYDAFGDKPVTSLFAEGTPSLPLTGTFKLPRTFDGTNVGPFGEGPARLTSAPAGPQGDGFPAGPGVEAAPISASRPSVAEEISRLGRPIQTSMSQQPPAINLEGDSDDTLFTNVSRAGEPFKLGGKALEEAEAKKAAQIRELLASEATDLPFVYGPEEVSFRPSDTVVKPRTQEGDVYRPDLNNELAMIRAGLTPKTDLEALNFGDRFLGSKRSFDEFGDPKLVKETPFNVNELIPQLARSQLPDYGDAMADLSGRAADYFKDARAGRLDQSPEEVYGDPSTAYLPSSVRDYFAQTIENQQKAMPGGGGRSGLGSLFAQTLENQQEGIPGGADPNAKPTLQSMFDKAKLYLQGKGEDISNMTQEDVINFAKSVARKAGDVVDGVTTSISDELTRRRTNAESAAFDADTLGVGSDPINFKSINKATAAQSRENQDNIDATAQTQIDQLMELLNKQQGAIDKQSGASSAALSEYLGGLEKDREFDKAMALANAGAALMMPSATIGEGVGKMIKAGTKTLQKGKDSYNKNKLQVLALQGRIDAAKASAANRSAISGATLSSRILLARREELADQLERLAPLGTEPKAEFADRVKELKRAIKQTDDQLNAMIMTASLGSGGAGNDIFASYNLTG